jgi:hypothetical protein
MRPRIVPSIAFVLLLAGSLVVRPMLASTRAGGAPTESDFRIRAYMARYAAGYDRLTPSFARQTGLACSACHTHYPELTAMGRMFKLNGYVYRRADSLQGRNPEGGTNLTINLVTPLSFMVQTSYTATAKAQPGTRNGTIFLPDQLSLFTGGEVTSHIGGFLQVTFDPQTGTLGVDNTDFRYANHTSVFGQHTIYGVSLNNNPTVQDVWNSTPAWGFPYGSSSAAPTPATSAIIDGGLGGQVAGLTAYTLWNDAIYLEVGAYRAAPLGTTRPLDSTAVGAVAGFAPYWRLAFPHNWGSQYLSLGTYGMSVRMYPAGINGPTNRFTDIGVDLSYLMSLGHNSITTDATWIHESQRWDAGGSANLRNTLSTFRFDMMYHVGHEYAFTVAPFMTTGSADTVLYAPAVMGGSRAGRPDSNGLIGEVDVMPWQNLRFQFQYVAYGKFNGASSNYDGFGRNASDNNTLYLLTWILF